MNPKSIVVPAVAVGILLGVTGCFESTDTSVTTVETITEAPTGGGSSSEPAPTEVPPAVPTSPPPILHPTDGIITPTLHPTDGIITPTLHPTNGIIMPTPTDN